MIKETQGTFYQSFSATGELIESEFLPAANEKPSFWQDGREVFLSSDQMNAPFSLEKRPTNAIGYLIREGDKFSPHLFPGVAVEDGYYERLSLTCPEEIFPLLQDLEHLETENFVVLYLDSRRRLIERRTISIGTLTACLVHPREVFRPAVVLGAHSVVVSHNHPSGDARPSADDVQLTRRLVEAGELIGISVLDHVIVGDGEFVSLRQCGLSFTS